MQKKITYIILLLFVQILFAQQPVTTHLTEKDGVPDNQFYDIVEDDIGNMWLAANKGLFKFDGANYTPFQHPDQEGISVYQLNKDDENVIWYINIASQIFYVKNEKVSLFLNLKDKFSGILPSMKVYKNLVILFGNNQLLIYDKHTKKELYHYVNETPGTLLSIEPYIDDSMLYFGRGLQFFKLDLAKLDTQKKELQLYSKPLQLLQTTGSVVINKDGIIHFRTKEKLYFYKISVNFDKNVVLLKHQIPNIRIAKVKVINNQIWYCTKDGVYVCELKNGELQIKRHLLANRFVTDVLVDKENNYWFTTLNNYLYVIPNIAINSIKLPIAYSAITKVTKGNTNELLITDTKVTLYKYHILNKQLKKYALDKGNKIYLSLYDSYRNTYVSYTNSGVYHFNSDFKVKKVTRSRGAVKSLQMIDSKTTMGAFSTNVKIIEEPFMNEEKMTFVLNKRGFTSFYDRKNNLRYFATIDGLINLDSKYKQQEIRYKGKPIYINSMAQTKNGIVWCSSFKNGVYGIKDNKIIKHYSEIEGLLSNRNKVVRAKENKLWIAGEKGIQQINLEKGDIKNLTKQDGIVSYNYNGFEIIDDNVYVSSPKNIIYFNESKVFRTYNIPEVFFTGITIENEVQPLQKQYKISYKNDIRINFKSIGYRSNASGIFKYRLKGFNNKWIQTKVGEDFVHYNVLPEGEYIFQISNVNKEETQEKVKEIKVVVIKPFWLKKWFAILLGIIVLLLIVKYYTNKSKIKEEERNKLLKQLEIDKELVNLKLENLRSQMNPHFIFNALNSIQEFILTNKKNLAGDYLGKFADLIRMYLSHSVKESITLEEEIGALNQYLELEKLRFEEDFVYNITCELETKNAMIPTMLIQPYVEKALKYGLQHKKGSKRLDIKFKYDNTQKYIVCEVNDNGVGQQKVQELISKQKRRPTAVKEIEIQDKLELLNFKKSKKIEIKTIDLYEGNQKSVGTKVLITIPVIKR